MQFHYLPSVISPWAHLPEAMEEEEPFMWFIYCKNSICKISEFRLESLKPHYFGNFLIKFLSLDPEHSLLQLIIIDYPIEVIPNWRKFPIDMEFVSYYFD